MCWLVTYKRIVALAATGWRQPKDLTPYIYKYFFAYTSFVVSAFRVALLFISSTLLYIVLLLK
jgi:hypothetical protein